MKKFLYILLMLVAFPFFAKAEAKKEAVYFYSDSCVHCQKVDAFFKEKGFYEKYDIQKLNMAQQKNQILLQKVFEKKGIEDVGIPAIIIDETLITGDTRIIANFERMIEKSNGTAREYIENIDKPKADENKQQSSGISLPVLVSAALVDAINPCAFAVLILLMATVISGQGKRRALYSGLLFSLAIFTSYFLMGLGLYKAITIFNIPKYLTLGVGILAVLIGLANIKDAFWYGKLFIMEVPLSWRPKMQSILRHVTSPFGALTAGFLVSLFLLPCSSGPYVVILGLLAQKVQYAQTVSLLLLYNLIFVLPMVLITLSMYFFNVKAGKLEKMRKDNLKLLHAVGGTIMLLLGLYLLKSWF